MHPVHQKNPLNRVQTTSTPTPNYFRNTSLTIVHKNHLLFTGISFTFISGNCKLRKVREPVFQKITQINNMCYKVVMRHFSEP